VRNDGRYRPSVPTAIKVSEPEMSKKRSVRKRMDGAATAAWRAIAAVAQGTTVRSRGDLKFVRAKRILAAKEGVGEAMVGGFGL
jgi:hypothetical protein